MYESGIRRLETLKKENHGGRWVYFQGSRPRGAITENSDTINGSVLWALSSDKSFILKLSPTDGSVLSQISLNKIFDMPATVTSRIMVAKSKSPPGEFLIFGLDVSTSHNEVVSNTFKNLCTNHSTNPHLRYYVVSIQLENSVVNWVIDTPNQYPVVGQIAGIKRGKDKANLLIVTTNAQQGSEVFAIKT